LIRGFSELIEVRPPAKSTRAIFLRATLREFAATGVAVFSVLLAISFSSALIQFLGLAARGVVPPDAVLILLTLSALSTVSVLLSATVFLSVLLTMTRSYRDSEMVVWQTSGLSLLAWLRPVLLFVAPVMLLVGLLSIYLTPWALGKAQEFRHQLENRDDASVVAPGVFKESKNADRVFFVEKLSPDLTQVANIFVEEMRDGRMWVGVASRGYLEKSKSGDRYLVAVNGRRYSGTPGQADYREEAFGKYSMRIEQSAPKSFLPSEKSRGVALLLHDLSPADKAELSWRLGLPVSTLLLALLAIPMSAVNPRTGRYLNLAMAVFVYMIYTNLVTIVQAWVAQGKIPVMLGMSAVHGGMAVLLVLLLARRTGYLRLPRLQRAA
jgi:lipopolysaccharide export system permease protein